MVIYRKKLKTIASCCAQWLYLW